MTGLLWTLGAAAALFVIGELAARLVLRRFCRPYVWRPGSRLHMHMDPESVPELESVCRSEANSEGERGPELPEDREGLFRILVIGGSAAECFYLDMDSGWPAVVGRELAKPENLARLGRSRVHVGNIARAGVGSVAMDLMLETLLPHYERVDLVLCMVGASDMLRWMARGAPADDTEGEIRLGDYLAVMPDRPYGWAPRRLALVEVLRRLRDARGGEVEVREKTGKKLKELRLMRAAGRKRDETGDPRVMLDRLEDHLRRSVERLRGKADRILFVGQPWFDKEHTPEEEARFWNAAQGDPFKGSCEVYFAMRVVAERMREVNARVAKVARETGHDYLELLPLIERSTETFYDFFHFIPAGARRIGEIVAAHLIERDESSRSS